MPLTVPRSLSPTRVNAFTDCPLAFRLRTIDHLPEPSSPPAVKGTLVHAALEGLIWHHPAGRRTRAAARGELAAAWRQLETDPELVGLGLTDDEAAEMRADAAALVDRYFELEDPNRVRAIGVELLLEAEVAGLRLRGIIDRLDLTEDGDLVIVDYKTGRAPGARFEQHRLTGVHLYALLCQRVLGRLPVEVRLLHLREPLVISAVPSEQTVRAQRQRTVAVWRAIERACEHTDFRPRPGPLCRYCNFQAWCPAFGGQPPAVAAGDGIAIEPAVAAGRAGDEGLAAEEGPATDEGPATEATAGGTPAGYPPAPLGAREPGGRP
ncbi:MAG: RecB family exonuclease [Acidimicrobiales bacterium]